MSKRGTIAAQGGSRKAASSKIPSVEESTEDEIGFWGLKTFQRLYNTFPFISKHGMKEGEKKEVRSAIRKKFRELLESPYIEWTNPRHIGYIVDFFGDVEPKKKKIAQFNEMMEKPEAILWTLSRKGVFQEDVEKLQEIFGKDDELETMLTNVDNTFLTEYLNLIIEHQSRDYAILVMQAMKSRQDKFLWSLPIMNDYQEQMLINIGNELATVEGVEIPGKTCSKCGNNLFHISPSEKGRPDDAKYRTAICAKCTHYAGNY